MNDVVFTGIGVVSPIGVGCKPFWESCRNARSGIRKITSFDPAPFRSNVAAEVRDFLPSEFMPPAIYRRMSRISRMAVAASVEALRDSGIAMSETNRDRMAVIMGTAYGSSSHIDEFYLSLLKEGPRGAQPLLFPETVPNAAASHVAMVHKIRGPNSTFCQNELSAENAVLYARNLLAQGAVDAVLVGGAEELSAALYRCYDALGVLNRVEVDDGDVPVPIAGGGMILGEGAAFLVMERRESALARGARIYGLLASGIAAGGPAHMGSYEPEGVEMGEAVRSALRAAHLEPADVDQITISANFTELDRFECDQIRTVFSSRPGGQEASPLKYLLGELGAAGSLRAAAVLLSLVHGIPLPTVRLEMIAGGRPVEWQIHGPREVRNALMTTSTFGGGSCSLVFVRAQ
jgi:3-oxoacyl-(acyl-carrier-protein) synthase